WRSAASSARESSCGSVGGNLYRCAVEGQPHGWRRRAGFGGSSPDPAGLVGLLLCSGTGLRSRGLVRASSVREVRGVNPLLALGLLAAVGLLATRLPRLPARHSLGLHPVFAAGALLLLLLGLVLGPGIGLLSGPALRALAPATALAIGWIGA